ncbi:DUF1848 domain-containing protein [Geoalkalibacter subterraneus]|uniref:DNA repair photolyase n=1 Tax=Geoalkalibacter subterraneus TaxID=483547 RepID=A0A0B5FEX8_9BACT|nr:DUF1848 domain-containing protein [Geoalkalibacter subterraneus]AJF06697.1 hypothetical protein GSUB_09315 [Geoalkalibacter subterraneus]
MRVVSVSRRTDIPAFYSQWLINRIRAGYACSRNPFNPRQISTVILQPDKVACLVFWSKDPRPLLPHLDELIQRRFRMLFHTTITALPEFLEPHVPASDVVCSAVRQLAKRLGPEKLIWRFDPIVLGRDFSVEQTLGRFERLAAELAGAVQSVRISFLQRYAQVTARLRNISGIDDLDALACHGKIPNVVSDTAAGLSEIAEKHGLKVFSCAERFDLAPWGIAPGRCLDPQLFEKLFNLRLDPRKDPGQRPACCCMRSVDLGMYGTCRHGCLYCYAATDRVLGAAVHDPESPLLFGSFRGKKGQGELFA